jgi:putrescine importer
MGVNAATIMHYFVRRRNRGWSYVALPLAGFLVCGYTWLNLRWTAKMAGLVWLVLGILYGLFRRLAAVNPPAATSGE